MQRIAKVSSYLVLVLSLILMPQLYAGSVTEKKSSFFKLMYPLIETENLLILKVRNKIINLKKKLNSRQKLTASEKTELTTLAEKYRVKKYRDDMNVLINKLLIKIDIIPPSLAIAQAANESAWGTSRFARLAKNYYGQWCFSKGCGIVPKRRSANSNHEVRSFSSVKKSVRSYMKNINSTRPYKELRKIRHNLKLKNIAPDGYKLAKGLMRYSSRGKEYVKEIRAMIKYNKLTSYDQRFWDLAKEKKLN